MWQGVGFLPPNLPITPGTGTDFGVGLFTPGQPLRGEDRKWQRRGAGSRATGSRNRRSSRSWCVRPTPEPVRGNRRDGLPAVLRDRRVERRQHALPERHRTSRSSASASTTRLTPAVPDVQRPGHCPHRRAPRAPIPVASRFCDNATTAQYNQLGLNCSQFSRRRSARCSMVDCAASRPTRLTTLAA